VKKKIIISLLVVILFLFSAELPGFASSLGTLKFGATGWQVTELQKQLRKVGYYHSSLDGVYGQQVEQAVIKFQQNYGLRIDGIAGSGTINKLYSVNPKVHWVQPGDNWFDLAQHYNIPIWKLKNRNNIYSNKLYIGQRLLIPAQKVSAVSYTASQQISPQEFNLLVRAVYSEARGEPYTGQAAVAAVILNRVEDPRFPDTIKGVVFEPWAFTAVHDGQFWLQPDQTARQAVQDSLRGWDPTGGAVFYYNPAKVTAHWIYSRKIITRIGKHYFAV